MDSHICSLVPINLIHHAEDERSAVDSIASTIDHWRQLMGQFPQLAPTAERKKEPKFAPENGSKTTPMRAGVGRDPWRSNIHHHQSACCCSGAPTIDSWD